LKKLAGDSAQPYHQVARASETFEAPPVVFGEVEIKLAEQFFIRDTFVSAAAVGFLYREAEESVVLEYVHYETLVTASELI